MIAYIRGTTLYIGSPPIFSKTEEAHFVKCVSFVVCYFTVLAVCVILLRPHYRVLHQDNT